ncbi:YceD family protein [Paenibacillus sp. 481]|uniref:YceD family protein n=1 Tax=Paenibacillus sp. 481 TaxID=2835869 RepID=UPI001E4210D9|nr:DUF177 domain-containing protein [Paenibacillus sp. 481]UHA73986.1 DUF177 domain-containing protein [Paenibacillus sp. 481]
MYFHFRDVSAKGHEPIVRETFAADTIVRDRSDIRAIKPVDVELTAKAEDDGLIDVQGQLTATAELTCSRCLVPHTETYVIPFHEQFKLTDSTDLPLDDEGDVIYVTDDRVDLTPFVEEALFVHLPLTSFCDESCKGLCATCGTNRNEQSCDCSNERIDPRLAGLKDFFKK